MNENIEQIYTIGICCHCGEEIQSNQKWEVFKYARPAVWESNYKEGPIHKKCALEALKRFNGELIRDIETMSNLVDNVVVTQCETIKKEKK